MSTWYLKKQRYSLKVENLASNTFEQKQAEQKAKDMQMEQKI